MVGIHCAWQSREGRRRVSSQQWKRGLVWGERNRKKGQKRPNKESLDILATSIINECRSLGCDRHPITTTQTHTHTHLSPDSPIVAWPHARRLSRRLWWPADGAASLSPSFQPSTLVHWPNRHTSHTVMDDWSQPAIHLVLPSAAAAFMSQRMQEWPSHDNRTFSTAVQRESCSFGDLRGDRSCTSRTPWIVQNLNITIKMVMNTLPDDFHEAKKEFQRFPSCLMGK